MPIGARNAPCQWQAATIYDDVPFATELALVSGVGAWGWQHSPRQCCTTPINLVALSKLREQCQMKLIPETLELSIP